MTTITRTTTSRVTTVMKTGRCAIFCGVVEMKRRTHVGPPFASFVCVLIGNAGHWEVYFEEKFIGTICWDDDKHVDWDAQDECWDDPDFGYSRTVHHSRNDAINELLMRRNERPRITEVAGRFSLPCGAVFNKTE